MQEPITPGPARARLRPRPTLMLGAGAALFVGCVSLFSAIGGSQDAFAGLAAVLELLVRAGWPVAAYLGGAAGLGRVFRPLVGRRRSLELALGLALLLSTGHAIGVLGGFARGGLIPGAIAWAPVAIGLALLLPCLRGARGRPLELNPWWLLVLPPLALMLVAACQPPGSLWSSEGYGYDALEYHLQLPQEWLMLGRIRPLEHNVYSFLPGYVEDAFLQLAVMAGATAHEGAFGLQTGDRAITAQLLSAAFGVLAAVGAGSMAARAAGAAGGEAQGRSRAPGPLIAAVLLGTPWFTVVGSSAYNDLAVLALMAPALAAAFNTALSPASRGIVTGLLVGVACGCKPTALLLAAPAVGIALLANLPPRLWARAVIPGAGAGVAALAPWLIRNLVYCGDPVFPAATGLFGHGHWSAAQVARYTAAHRFSGSLLDRLALLVVPDRTDPLGPAHRGLLHPQYLALFPAIALGLVVAGARQATRRPALILLAGFGAQLVAWLLATHLQSRFLLPLTVTGAAGLGLALAAPGGIPSAPRMVARRGACLLAGLVGLVGVAQLTASILNYSSQAGGHPNQLLLLGPDYRTGEVFRAELTRSTPSERELFLQGAAPEQYCNLALPPGSRLYLLAEARPFYFTVPLMYNTTWDRWPLAEAVREHPGDPRAWAGALRGRGITHILYNAAEMARLQRSGKGPGGWADPALTPPVLDGFFTTGCTPVRSWPDAGITIFALREPISSP